MESIINEISFIGQRFTAESIPDILLVALMLLILIKLLQGTRGFNMIRGLIIAFVFFGALSLIKNLTAFNWVISNATPVLLIMIPVVFAPEIRRSIDRIGGMKNLKELFSSTPKESELMYGVAENIADACMRLSNRNHGALIVMEYFDNLDKEITAGVNIDAKVSVELLLQIFYPNTPLHDGAVIIRDGRIYMASCVMPLSAKNSLEKNPERHFGLRHRAALGVSEETDCLAIVVSEETGSISLCRNGGIRRDLSPKELSDIIKNAYIKPANQSFWESVKNIVGDWNKSTKTKDGK
ncbi:MAG: diadenylate cyclase CdaA [Anaerolineaceae bacterium]|nr:diadenylate cyclase CdaA [Anaerolineaceae bacterium]